MAVRQSKTVETVKIKETTGLNPGQRNRQENQGVNTPIESGLYIMVPMDHFTVETQYNGQTFDSQRLLMGRLTKNKKDVEYARSLKISLFTGSLAVGAGVTVPDLKAEDRDGRQRPPQGVLKYTVACKERIPHTTREEGTGKNKKYIYHLDDAIILKIDDQIDGYNPVYEETNPGEWDVVSAETGFIQFEKASIYPISIEDYNPSDELIQKFKEYLANDSQFKNVKVD